MIHSGHQGRCLNAASSESKWKTISAVRDLIKQSLHTREALPDKHKISTQLSNTQENLLDLTNALIDELEDLRKIATGKMQRHQQHAWLNEIKSMRTEVNDKLLHFELQQASMMAELQDVKSAVQAGVEKSRKQSEVRIQQIEGRIQATCCNVQELRNKVDDVLSLTSEDFPNVLMRQRLEDKDAILSSLTKAFNEIAPAAIQHTLSSLVTPAVRQTLSVEIKEAAALQTESMRQQLATYEEDARGISGLSQEVLLQLEILKEQVAESMDLSSLSEIVHQQKQSLQMLSNEIEDKLEMHILQQVSYQYSMEGVLRAMVEDVAHLSSKSQAHHLNLQQHHDMIDETREALLRSAATFSQLLKIPAPLPASFFKSSKAVERIESPYGKVDVPSGGK
ncbi:hypothetical protein CEUSTIGMA_g7004.t1 [Chlamydomonas eustigma]|uniref:Uncharacterized protein n=1 Tax=Chlamydomonas eustigma TaxID=1157962 RepID=A0A250X909_9CHLO|nr:hypothetical protein CEUSTIGMA_g7004.t1 [Chlamydomonas eustigma]|eukprot:GAX79563.1 hypothetical protein CEUSTIGMA_g7004.t1 [Chlamydomonas eustigma]